MTFPSRTGHADEENKICCQGKTLTMLVGRLLLRQTRVYRRAVHRVAPLAVRALTTSSTVGESIESLSSSSSWHSTSATAVLAASLLAIGATLSTVDCEEAKKKKKSKKNKKKKQREELSPSKVSDDDIEKSPPSLEDLPEYTADQVAVNNGDDGKPIWMSYGGVVYDVTDFIVNHPGGSEKILQAAGSAIEPFWFLYRQHFASDLPMKLMEHMAIGRLNDEDQAAIDAGIEALEENDPYAKEPLRHKALIVHSDTPMNAEVPAHILQKNYLTPTSLFYIRHHHPVPYMTEKQIAEYKLKVDLSAYGKGVVELSVDDLKKMKSVDVVATLQCSGNRRSGFNAYKRTSGTPWGQGAISTAKFTGVPLRDVLKAAGLDDPIAAEEQEGLEHVRFHAGDGMMASIGIEKACNPYGDVIVCYAMNGEPLPREHGFPLRVIVPGYAAVRNVKWLEKIELAKTEAEGAWQRGLNYKTLPPSVTDAKGIDLDKMPSMTEVSLFSGITDMEVESSKGVHPGDRVKVTARGWAWSGGGRNIVRVDVTPDDGKTWITADLKEGSNQRFGRAWAWVFWEAEIPEAVVREDGSVRLASKAVDLAFNVQPESSDHGWNVRGLGNNSWFRAETKVV